MARTTTAVTLNYNSAMTLRLLGRRKVRFVTRDGAIQFRPTDRVIDNVLLAAISQKNAATASSVLRVGKVTELAIGNETTPLTPGVSYTVEPLSYHWYKLVPVTPENAHRPERVTVSRAG